jgi:hypothetical protein
LHHNIVSGSGARPCVSSRCMHELCLNHLLANTPGQTF